MNFLYIGKKQDEFTEVMALDVFDVERFNQISLLNEHNDFEKDFKLDTLCREAMNNYGSIQLLLIDLDWFGVNDYLGARLAHHVRLTPWLDKIIQEIPIILLRSEPIDIAKQDIIKDELLIFAGGGAFFSTYKDLSFDLVDPFTTVNKSFNVNDIIRRHKKHFIYTNYLNGLRFSEQHDDSHSITNQWGALRLAHNIGYSSDDIKYNWPPKLFFKYLQAKYNFKHSTQITQITAKVLFIDDNADKGWEKVLKKLFNYNDDSPTLDGQGQPTFRTINEKVKDYNSLSENSKKIIEEQEFDLYLIDLRLNGADEDITTETSKLSGATVLYKIKSKNAGNQVIMFTASNKAWNMRALLNGDNAADGYYIKESPLNATDGYFGHSNTDNLLQQINLSLRCIYHKKVWSLYKEIGKSFENNIDA